MAITPQSNVRLPGYVSVHDMGWTPQGTDQANQDAVEAAVATGKNVYFPGGHRYEMIDRIYIDAKLNQRFFGDGPDSVVAKKNTSDNTAVFFVNNSQGVEFENLHIEGAGNGQANGNRDGIVLQGCKRAKVNSCSFTKLSSRCIDVIGTDGYTLTNNIFYDNNGLDEESNCFDISVRDNTGAIMSHHGVINDNLCLSNNKVGISVGNSGRCKNVTITGNVIVACDQNLVEVAAGSIQRKEGIVLQYETSIQTSADDFQTTCSGNFIANCGWAGIYSNWSAGGTGEPHKGGTHTITGNTIVRTCRRISATATNLQGGISVTQGQLVTISGNTIKDVGTNPNGSGNFAAGIRWQCEVGEDIALVTPVCTISGNTVAECQDKGVVVWSNAGPCSIVGNTIKDCGTSVDTFSSNDGRIQFNSNTVQSKQTTGRICYFNNSNSRHDLQVHSNRIEQQGTLSGSAEFIGFSGNKVSIQGNKLRGHAAGNGTGIWVQNTTADARDKINISGNVMRRLNVGIHGNSVTEADGPLIVSNNTIEDTTTPIFGANVYEGTGGQRAVVHGGTAAPTGGKWKEGDLVLNGSPTTGNPMGWMRSTTSTWLTLPNAT